VTTPNPSGSSQVGVQTGGPGLLPATDGATASYADMYGLVGMLGTDFARPVFFDTQSVLGVPDNPEDATMGPGGQDRTRRQTGVRPITLTPEQMMDNLAVWGAENPQALLDMREKLYARGLYGAINAKDLDPRRTAVGTADFKALGEAIKGYYIYLNAKQKAAPNGGGENTVTFNQWLAPKDASGNPTYVGPAGPGGTPRAPLSLTNQADITAAGDSQSRQMLGHAMDASGQGALVDQYHGQEQSAYDAAGVANGDAYAQPASVQAAARDWVLQNNLPEYAQHQAESFMNAFANMFLSGQSSRAQTSLGDAAVGS
jgi:hypothetical protein